MRNYDLNHRNAGDEDESSEGPASVEKPFHIMEAETVKSRLSFYLSGAILSPGAYVEMIDRIRNAKSDEDLYIYINSTGGDLDTGIQLMNAMRQSEATITTVLDSQAYSMAALLFLSGDKKLVGNHALMMFHQYSSDLGGKGNELLAEVTMSARWFANIMADLCSPFLSQKEIADVLTGKDIWLESTEIIARLQKVSPSSNLGTTKKPKTQKKKTEKVASDGAVVSKKSKKPLSANQV